MKWALAVLWLAITCCLGQQGFTFRDVNTIPVVVRTNAGGGGPPPPPANTNFVVQHLTMNSIAPLDNEGITMPNNSVWRIHLPNPTQAGNTLLVPMQANNSPAWTDPPGFALSDNKGTVYTRAAKVHDTSNLQDGIIFIATNIQAGITMLFLTNATGATGLYVQMAATELCHILAYNPIDKTNVNFNTGLTVTAGSITPTQTGDFIYQYTAWDHSTLPTSWVPGSQANITWKLLAAETVDPIARFAIQCGQYNSVSAINPTMTQGPDAASGWLTMAVALKTDVNQGNPTPNGMQIVGLHHLNIWKDSALTITNQVPSYGNLQVFAWQSGHYTFYMTNVSDTCGNTYTHLLPPGTNVSIYPATDWWYAANAIADSTNKLTMMIRAVTNHATILVYDVVGAATSPFDTRVHGTGNQAAAGNLTAPVGGITPARSGGIIFCQENHDFNTTTNMFSGQATDCNFYTGEPLDGPCRSDENNGWSHTNTVSTVNQSFVWRFVSSGTALGNWAADAVSFLPP